MSAKADESKGAPTAKQGIMKKAGLVLVVAGAIVLALAFILPTRYYFKLDQNQLTLCSGKFGPLGVHKDPDFSNIPAGSEELAALAKIRFKTREEAVQQLQQALIAQIKKTNAELAPLEAQLAASYADLIKQLEAARKAKVPGLDKRIEGLKAWLQMRAEEGTAKQGKIEHKKAAKVKAEKAKAEEVKAERIEAEMAKAKEAKVEKMKAEEAKAEKAKAAEEVKAEKIEAEMAKAKEAKVEKMKAEEAKAKEAKHEEGKAEHAKTE